MLCIYIVILGGEVVPPQIYKYSGQQEAAVLPGEGGAAVLPGNQAGGSKQAKFRIDKTFLKELRMKRVLMVLILIALPMISQADDTIHCPNDKNALQAGCDRVAADIRNYEPQLKRSEQTLNNPNNLFFFSNKTGYYRTDGSYVKFPWLYHDKALNRNYVGMNPAQLRDYMWSTYRNSWSINYRQALDQSPTRRNELLSPDSSYGKWKHYVQQLYIYRAQCCGGRWTNDVGIDPQRRGTSGGPAGDGLVGVPFPGQNR
jgi:hypothetical protein